MSESKLQDPCETCGFNLGLRAQQQRIDKLTYSNEILAKTAISLNERIAEARELIEDALEVYTGHGVWVKRAEKWLEGSK